MSKVRSGVVLVALLLLGMPALASDQLVVPSPAAFLADIWSEMAEIVELVFEKSETGAESGPILDPNGIASPQEPRDLKRPSGLGEPPPEDESGPILDPGG